MADMWDLLANKLSGSSSSTRELVFSLISHQGGHTIAELTKKLKEVHGLKISYQATRKAVHALQDLGAVEQSAGKFRLKARFLFSAKAFFDNLISDLDSLSKHKLLLRHESQGDFFQFEFGTLFETDNGWGEIILEICKPLPKGQQMEFVGIHSFCWWMLFNLGRETNLFDSLRERGYPSRMIFTANRPLTRWACRVYKEVGVRADIMKIEALPENHSLNIFGDRVIQVEYPPALFSRIKTIFEKTRSIEQVKSSDLTQLAHARGTIRLSVFHNRTMAEAMLRLIS